MVDATDPVVELGAAAFRSTAENDSSEEFESDVDPVGCGDGGGSSLLGAHAVEGPGCRRLVGFCDVFAGAGGPEADPQTYAAEDHVIVSCRGLPPPPTPRGSQVPPPRYWPALKGLGAPH